MINKQPTEDLEIVLPNNEKTEKDRRTSHATKRIKNSMVTMMFVSAASSSVNVLFSQ